jgi:hypothetical protein
MGSESSARVSVMKLWGSYGKLWGQSQVPESASLVNSAWRLFPRWMTWTGKSTGQYLLRLGKCPPPQYNIEPIVPGCQNSIISKTPPKSVSRLWHLTLTP